MGAIALNNRFYGTSAQVATTESLGLVRPDGITVKITSDGTISSVGGGGSITSQLSIGQGYGVCDTDASSINKSVTLPGFVKTTGGIVAVRFEGDVPNNSTLDVNNTGEQPIYFANAAITSGIIKAGETATFIDDGTNYILLSTDGLISRMIAAEVALTKTLEVDQ